MCSSRARPRWATRGGQLDIIRPRGGGPRAFRVTPTVFCGDEVSLGEVRSSIRASQPGTAQRRFSHEAGTAETARPRLPNNEYVAQLG